ncbi:MAG: NUDIX domain-containing protein [Saprospiraceae bacterium]
MNIEAQKYKIWVNKAWIVWMKPDEFKSFKFSKVSVYILLQDPGSEMIKSYLDQLLAGTLHHQVVIVTKKIKQSWDTLLQRYPLILAAGGMVRRKKDHKYLFIYRRGWWDLPKGKLDDGENFRRAAVREVREEVGLDTIILKRMQDTYHAYIEKDKKVIKRTAWYLMECAEDKVELQAEEDITQKKWVGESGLPSMSKKVYPNLINIILEAGKN